MEDTSPTSTYTDPVARLLTQGEPKGLRDAWDDYSSFGFGAEHVPELVRMATDMALNQAKTESDEVWAPVHAWRILGQLGAEEAIEPLLKLLHLVDDEGDDILPSDMPKVMAMIGPAAVPAIVAYLKDAKHGVWARAAAGESLSAMGGTHPETRDACVAALTEQLACFADNGPDLNAFLVSALTDLSAVESASVMEQAFAAGEVDLFVQGDWEEVQLELGLLDQRTKPRPRGGWLGVGLLDDGPPRATGTPSSSGKSQAKAKKKKRKDQKKSRKKNRKK